MIGDADAMDAESQIGNLRVYAIDSVLPSNPAPQSASNALGRESARDAFGDRNERAEAPQPEGQIN
jgi:hypothetical protein